MSFKGFKSLKVIGIVAGIAALLFLYGVFSYRGQEQRNEPSPQPTSEKEMIQSQPMEIPSAPLSAFLVQTDPKSIASFEQHATSIQTVIPDWFFVTKDHCAIDQHINPHIHEILKKSKVKIMPRVANVKDGIWRREELRKILKDQDERFCLVQALTTLVVQHQVDGLNLDFEDISPDSSEDFVLFAGELAQRLHEQGKILTIDVPPHNPVIDRTRLAQVADRIVLMAYDEHYLTSAPGPIASQAWIENAMRATLAEVPQEKLSIALGNYAYDWNLQRRTTRGLTWQQAYELSQKTGAQIRQDPVTKNKTFTYKDERQHTHEVWLLDAETFSLQRDIALTLRPAEISLWRLGSEDPALWSKLETKIPAP